MNKRNDMLATEAKLRVDPVTFQIVNGALIAATRAMAAILQRAARSTIIRETQDFSTALFDAKGSLAAQSEAIPLHLHSLSYSLGFCLADFPAETLEADDVLVVNDPYHGGQHLPDIQVFAPVVHEGVVVGFVGNLAHHTDISGGIGSMNPTAKDVFMEGMRIPPIKFKRHDLDGPMGRLLLANSRQPEVLLADLEAQMAANATGAARFLELIGKYGRETIEACIGMAQDKCEMEMRNAIRAIPNGVYTGEDYLDGDGFTTDPLCIRVTVTVHDEDLDIDFTGTDPQAKGFVNSPIASTLSAAGTAVRALLGHPDMATNDGSFRPMRVHAPEGCLLNPRYPSPVRLRMNSGCRAYGAVLQALGKAVPERAAACGFDTTTCVNFAFLGPKGYQIYMEPMRGGLGGTAAGVDGVDAISQLLSNSANTPVEVAESDNPWLRIREYSLRPDSGGAGQYQGGLGCVREFEIAGESVEIVFSSDRALHQPWGLWGGSDGQSGKVVAIRKGERTQLPANGAALTMTRGERLRVETGGGGGLGDPVRRDRARVERDLRAGRISAAFAKSAYDFELK